PTTDGMAWVTRPPATWPVPSWPTPRRPPMADLTDLTERLRHGMDGCGWSCDFAEEHDTLAEAADALDSLTRERDDAVGAAEKMRRLAAESARLRDEASLRIENLEADRNWWRDA